jgi:hypothetical protein
MDDPKGDTPVAEKAESPLVDFDTAKEICERLSAISADRQSRILRWVSELLGVGLGLSGPTHPAPPPAAGLAIASSRSGGNIKTFVEEKRPKSDNQFAAVVAYYYKFEANAAESADSISAETLQNATRLASRHRIVDPGKTLRNAAAQGYLDSAGRGEFRINSVGENLVAMTLPGAAEARVRGKASTRKNSAGPRARTSRKSATR